MRVSLAYLQGDPPMQTAENAGCTSVLNLKHVEPPFAKFLSGVHHAFVAKAFSRAATSLHEAYCMACDVANHRKQCAHDLGSADMPVSAARDAMMADASVPEAHVSRRIVNRKLSESLSRCITLRNEGSRELRQ